MNRFAVAATLTLATFMASAPVAAQTVEDYRQAVANAPVVDVAPVVAARHCAPIGNFVSLSIPTWELKPHWIAAALPVDFTGPVPAVAARRTVCAEVSQQAVIAFSPGGAEEIVTPPTLEDADKIYKPLDAPLPGTPNYGAPAKR